MSDAVAQPASVLVKATGEGPMVLAVMKDLGAALALRCPHATVSLDLQSRRCALRTAP